MVLTCHPTHSSSPLGLARAQHGYRSTDRAQALQQVPPLDRALLDDEVADVPDEVLTALIENYPMLFYGPWSEYQSFHIPRTCACACTHAIACTQLGIWTDPAATTWGSRVLLRKFHGVDRQNLQTPLGGFGMSMEPWQGLPSPATT